MKEQGLALKSYVTGFVLSLAFTLGAYFLVNRHVNSDHAALTHRTLIVIIIGFALLQFIAQLYFFLHLGREGRPRWNLTAFLFALMVVFILVAGSLWIMANLDYHHPDSSHQSDKYIIHDEGFGG